jgi:CDP-diacylglycerol--glycerol-3-phosphate 3-phosphatidyltransferase
MPSLYDLKPHFQALLRPASRTLLAAGISPNAVTLAALALSVAAGGIAS